MSDLAKISEIAKENSLARIQNLDEMEGAIQLAKAIGQLRKLFGKELMTEIAGLAGSRLGFLTDKAYTLDELRDPVIECLLRGGRLVGNEFNVIASSCYMTLAYYERVVGELVSNLDIQVSVPVHATDETALVSGRAEFLVPDPRSNIVRPNSVTCEKDERGDFRIPVRVNKGMGPDAVLGKALRKILAKVYRHVTGCQWVDHDARGETIEPRTVEQGRENARRRVEDHQANIITDIDKVLATADESLPECADLTAVGELHAHLMELLPDGAHDALSRLGDLCEARRVQIRAERGGRTNGR